MNTAGMPRRQQLPPESVLTGHPHPGRPHIRAAEAAERLGVTPTTVRTWIDRGELAGFCVPAGRVFLYFAYDDAVSYRRDLPVPPRGTRHDRFERRLAAVESLATARTMALENLVTVQAGAMDELRSALRAEQEASELLMRALSARKAASEALLRAEQAAAAVVSVLGVPAFPPASFGSTSPGTSGR